MGKLDYIQHEAARAKVQSILNDKGATDEWITELLIRTDMCIIGLH